MRRTRHFPSRDRLSVLTAVILLAYALTRFLDLPVRALHTTVFGSALSLELGGPLLMLVLTGALIGTGADTLIRSHPAFARRGARSTVQHWLLPGATALVLGAALNRLPEGLLWWLGLGVSALALLAVLVAEYVLVDPDDPAREAAALTLTALAYALALVLFVLLRSLGARAAISAPVGGLVAAGLAWRLFALRQVPVGPATVYAGLIGLIAAEIIWALNYWRVNASSAGVLAMIPFYFGVGIAQHHLSGRLSPRVWVEYGLVGGLGFAIALWYAFARGQ